MSSEFYAADATAIYAPSFDFTVVEPEKVQPNVSRKTLGFAIRRTLSTAAIAVAVSYGILSIPAKGVFPFGVSVTESIKQKSSRSPGIIEMTALMHQRAEIAARLFHSVPHPGDDDVEPDYGF